MGKDANEAWNKIIDEFSRLENSSHVDNLVIKTRLLAQYKNLYVYTKALIRQLMFITPDSGGAYGKLASESIRDLQNMGYNINVSSSKEYAKSIYAADKRSNYLVTRIKLTQKEVDSLNSSSKKGENKLSFDREVTIISSSLGFSVPNDLTLSTYCEYKKRIKERNKHYEKMKRKTRR